MITPQQAAQLTREELLEIEEWERKIDKGIKEWLAKWGGDEALVEIRGMPRRVREHLTRKYQANGWQVVYQDDQRDGTSLTLRPRPPQAGKEEP